MTRRVRVWIDRGGTFTDCLAWLPPSDADPEGQLRVTKLLSSDHAPVEGIRTLLNLSAQAPIPPCDIRMGTTLATNALLERKGTPTGLVITDGFGDLLHIGDQTRPDLFDLHIRRPACLHQETLEVAARLDNNGGPLVRPEPEAVGAGIRAMVARGVDSLAIVVLHAYRDGQLERDIGELAAEAGVAHVSLSHEVSEEIGLLGRADTTVADAYLTPLIAQYVRTLLAELPGSVLRIMQSNGGLTDSGRFRGRDAVLSGPAGGVVAVAEVARLAGCEQVIGFDMGGTSTDVCRWAGSLERVYETNVAGVRLRAPMVAVHTVAAGGGSICKYDGGRFTVGPQSAGAVPGPVCYGRADAHSLTLTDVNLVLGRVRADRFPIPLHRAPVDAALGSIGACLEDDGAGRPPEEVAEGFFRIAVENMAAAIRRVSVERGHDVRDHAMVVFGGAGGQFACAVARRLGMKRILSHPLAGVLSAWGMGVARVSWHGEADVLGGQLGTTWGELDPVFAALEAEALGVLGAEGVPPAQVHTTRRIDLRYVGTETSLTMPLMASADELRRAFEELHQREFGYSRPDHPVQSVVARLEAVSGTTHWDVPHLPAAATPAAAPTTTRLWVDGAWTNAPICNREAMIDGQPVAGPAVILEDTGTFVVEPGFEARVDPRGVLIVDDLLGVTREQAATSADPVLLEIFNNLFMSIAEQMGTVLRRTALSTNIRERLDYSCAVFDPTGGLVANAPHIPVHLGAMGESVRAVIAAHPEPLPGDVFVTNNPSCGGSHLPDITVVTPVHDPSGGLAFFTASRGHHADVGGTTPGSMPAFSSTLSQEGVVLPTIRLVRAGRFDVDAVRALFASGPHPARRPDDNVADLRAQVAANRKGQLLLAELTRRYGPEVVHAYMGHVQDNAAARVSEAIEGIKDGEHHFADEMDDGTSVQVTVRVAGGSMHVDFEGTGPESPGNLNAPRAVTIAAVLYVLRCLVGSSIPLNSGCLRPVTIRVPEPSLLAPRRGRAVAGGNVETSQRIVDVLLGALGQAAASQGTMNNLTFGDETFGYYETIGGGAGAGPGFDGASGVHTHMTNSRITDPEVLEARFPVRLIQFARRRGSGGEGRHRGGDGLVRELEALRPLRVSILSERRTRSPFGLAGGSGGQPGVNQIDGRDVGGKVDVEVAPGGRIRIETPGGGGYGAP